MKLTRTPFTAAILLALSVSASAQQTVNIPVPALVCQGSQTKFKHAVRLNMNTIAKGQSIPFSARMALVQTSSYGKRQADGLVPVSVAISITSFSGDIGGVPIPDVKKKLSSIALPKVTTWYNRTGQPYDLKITGLPKQLGADGAMWKSATSLTQLSNLMGSFPMGEVTFGEPISQTINLPVGPNNMRFQMTSVPTEIITVAGEKAVRFTVEATSDVDLSGVAVPQAKPGVAHGGGIFKITGEMAVGLKTGEVIRQSFKPYLLLAVDAGEQSFEAEIDMTVEGYRLKG